MNNSRLNINIYEHIIDTLNNNSYWCTTALVCSAWCRRSQYNLFRTVHLCRQSQVELLVQTFRTNALLVDLVTSLTVDFTGQLRDHPLIWVPLLWEVKKCSALDLMGIDWTRYPDMYASSVLREVQRCGSSTITTLKIKLFQTVFRPTLLLIQALPCLKNLVVYCPRRLHTTSHTFAAAIPKQAACNRLHSLELQLDSAETKPWGASELSGGYRPCA
ncbi:hypothetical protein C8Q74DRAFT_1215109 [Fomes fomentarius]|nr:hypothetical protein C8Q74DRAFT_1215109 [Fomes fomentarius]